MEYEWTRIGKGNMATETHNNVSPLRPQDKKYTSKDQSNQQAMEMSESARMLAQLCQMYVGNFKTMQAVVNTSAFKKSIEETDESMTAVLVQSILIVNRFAPEIYKQVKLIEQGEDR
jgi:hypothetical protein